MWNLKKMIQVNLCIKQKQTNRHREQIHSYQRGKAKGRDKEFQTNAHTILYIKQIINKDTVQGTLLNTV